MYQVHKRRSTTVWTILKNESRNDGICNLNCEKKLLFFMIKNTLEENLISSVICFTLHIAAHRKSCRQHTCCFIHLWYCYVLIFCHNSNTIPNDGNLNTTGCVGYAPKTLSATKSKRYQQSKRIHLFWLANWNYLDSYLFEKKKKQKQTKKQIKIK